MAETEISFFGRIQKAKTSSGCFRDPCQNYQTKKAKIKKLEILIIKEIARIEKVCVFLRIFFPSKCMLVLLIFNKLNSTSSK